ncbi:MAG: hypothetical protein KAJ05_05440, partial [Candidatus Latescibacteria bacterium]|nr:hypothetical protein [Candidatus Latescibacterota bacterium]
IWAVSGLTLFHYFRFGSRIRAWMGEDGRAAEYVWIVDHPVRIGRYSPSNLRGTLVCVVSSGHPHYPEE